MAKLGTNICPAQSETQKNQLLFSLKKKINFIAHKQPWNKQKYYHGS
jgi:hypothetical protein